MKELQFQIDSSHVNVRIDKFLNNTCEDLSRSYLQKLITDGLVLVNHNPIKSNYKLRLKDEVILRIPDPVVLEVAPENIPLDILYEDKDVIVINKPKGMVVHPANGHMSGTLVNALMYHCGDNLSSINGVLRPGIVHRIDMDTTGVLVVCKNDVAHISLAEQLKNHSITRRYHAIVYHNLKEDTGTIIKPLGRHPIDRKKQAIDLKNGREAITHYRVLELLQGKYTYIECTLETGRTHQIRVHMSSIQHPLLGDAVYGPANNPYHLQGQTLHAKVLGFIHPRTGKYMEFEAPLPDYFSDLLAKLR